MCAWLFLIDDGPGDPLLGLQQRRVSLAQRQPYLEEVRQVVERVEDLDRLPGVEREHARQPGLGATQPVKRHDLLDEAALGLLIPVGPQAERYPARQPGQEIGPGRHRVEVVGEAADGGFQARQATRAARAARAARATRATRAARAAQYGFERKQEAADERVLPEDGGQVVKVAADRAGGLLRVHRLTAPGSAGRARRRRPAGWPATARARRRPARPRRGRRCRRPASAQARPAR